jgi:hypothetical protein
MINKTISMHSTVKHKNDELKEVVHMSCNIDSGMTNLNLSLHIIDKESYKENLDELKQKFEEFLNQSLQEAISVGWDMLDINKK